MLKFEGSWEPLVGLITEAVKKNELLKITLPKEEYDRLRKLNGPFFCGKGLGNNDLPKDISNRLFLIPGSGGKTPTLFVGHSVGRTLR